MKQIKHHLNRAIATALFYLGLKTLAVIVVSTTYNRGV